jgi:hypothetical protein
MTIGLGLELELWFRVCFCTCMRYWVVGRTSATGFRPFAECLGHSAKPRLHSAKALPSVTLSKGYSAVIMSAKTSLPSAFCRTLGKGFAECQGRHSAKKSSRDGVWGRDDVFAECPWVGTRQRKVAVMAFGAVTASLPSALELALGKDWALCRVPLNWHSAKSLVESLPRAWDVALGKV